MKFLSRLFVPKPRKSRRRLSYVATEALESRQLLTVAFNFIWQGNITAGGSGFEHGTLGQGRRDALVAVGQQLGAQFTHTATIDVAVTSSENANITTLASAGSNSTGNASAPTFGGLAVTRNKILTGQDLNGAGVGNEDATVDVNWGHNWDISPNPGNIDETEQDFYSTMAHELLHALGFASGVSQTGQSPFQGQGVPFKWDQFDRYLTTSAGAPLISQTGVINQAAWDFNSIGGDSSVTYDGTPGGLFFNGPATMAANGGQPVGLFTPTVWSPGSAVSHLDDQNPTLQSSMMRSAAFQGPGVRGLSSIERAVLVDLGYQLVPQDIVVTETAGTWVTEGGPTDTFTVQLASQPQNDVVLTLNRSNQNHVAIDQNQLTFTSNNWNVPQTVTVTGVDDNTIPGTGFDTSRIYIDVNAGQSDAAYANVLTTTVTVHKYDDDNSVPPTLTSVAGAANLTPTITWQAVPGIQTYDVVISPFGMANQNTNPQATIVHRMQGVTGTTYTVPANILQPNTAYQIELRSENANAQGGHGIPVGFSTRPAPVVPVPGAVTLNTPTGVTTGTPTFTWTADGNAATYDLWVNQVGGQNQIIRQQALNGTTFTAQNNLPQGQYRGWVRASNAAGNGPWSVPQVFTIGTPPATITLNAPTNTTTGTPTFSWTAIAGATQYDLWVNQVNGQNQIIRQQNIQGTTFTVSAQNELPNGGYRGWVRPITAAGPGAWSAATNFSIGPSLVAPVLNAPTGAGTGTPTFTWNQVATATTYDLWVNQDGGTNQIIRQQILPGTTFTAQNNLAAGTYTAWVRAANATVTGPWSAALKFNIGTAPGQVTVNAPVGQTTSTPTITWTTDPIANVYELWVNQVGGQNQIIYNANVQGTQFNVVNALPVGNYRVWVRAVSAQGLFGPWSQVVNFTV
ncbi:MAG: hypothetical protein R3C59_05150 [Planctomycetaceae bacterium]